MKTPSFAALFVILAYLCSARGECVKCKYQMEACVCQQNEAFCEFTLLIEELQTFASYDLKTDGSSKRIPGRTYYLNSTGFNPAVMDLNTCSIDATPVLYKEDFDKVKCTLPMTVDGVTYRRFIGVNGRIPGPTLIVTENQLVKVRVLNNLTSEGITIHWHGMHQVGTPWMDGVGFISQYPIGAGEYFDYIYNATPAGTHWYHSHVGAQRTDGLFGGLVVKERGNYFGDIVVDRVKADLHLEPYQTVYDLPENHTMTLLDWQGEDSLDLFVRIHSSLRFHPYADINKVPTTRDRLYNPTVSIDNIEVGPVPYWTGLINGRGRANSSTFAPLSVFSVLREAAYRFRVIGAQSLYAYSLSIDGHQLTVIASDGHFTKPVIVDYLIVHSGERYDFIVETYGTVSQSMFWIRAETLQTSSPTGRNHTALAILRYGPTGTVDWRNRYDNIPAIRRPCSTNEPCKVINCPFANYPDSVPMICVNLTDLTSLFPVEDEKTLPDLSDIDGSDDACPDCLQFFNFGFEGEFSTSAVNGRNFKLPVTPYQTNCGQYQVDLKDGDTCDNCLRSMGECECIHVVKIVQAERFSPSKIRTVVMVFSAIGGGFNFSHPIHLHGHSFFVLHIGHGEYDENGSLIANSTDISCNDIYCTTPSWRSGIPAGVMNALGTGNRIKNNLIRKDTVIVPGGGYVVVAFQADNPGYWFLHCHIEVHQLEGMGVLIQEYNYTEQKKPPANIDSPGHFSWDMEDYTKMKKKGATCSACVAEVCLIVLFLLGLLNLHFI